MSAAEARAAKQHEDLQATVDAMRRAGIGLEETVQRQQAAGQGIEAQLTATRLQPSEAQATIEELRAQILLSEAMVRSLQAEKAAAEAAYASAEEQRQTLETQLNDAKLQIARGAAGAAGSSIAKTPFAKTIKDAELEQFSGKVENWPAWSRAFLTRVNLHFPEAKAALQLAERSGQEDITP